MTVNNDARALACQSWFGYGRWDAPYWFIGMEPGGEDDIAWYDTWLRLGGDELCDCREHHLGTNYPKWHGRDLPPTQPTWLRLIQLLLGYGGKQADKLDAIRVYQKDEWGSSNGETALLEVSAIRAKSLATAVERNTFREQRIVTLRNRLERYQPTFAVFYGFEYSDIYEKIANARFDADGYALSGSTLCVLLRHPTAQNNPKAMKSGDWWAAKGQKMRRRIATDEERHQAQVSSLANRPQDPPILRARAKHSRTLKENGMGSENQPNSSDVIRVLVKENPKRGGSKSRARFDCYEDGATVADYESTLRNRLGDAEARKHKLDIQWDLDRDFIRVERDGKPMSLSISLSLQLS